MYTEFQIKNKKYRLIHLKSNEIILEIDELIQNNIYQKLLHIINDLNLNILINNKSGNPKNTRQLGKEIIKSIGNVKQFDEDNYFFEKKYQKNINSEFQLKNVTINDSLFELSGKYSWKRLHIKDNPYEFNSIKLKFSEESYVYRWYILKENEEFMLYIGETKNFTKRVNQYVKPGIKQKTNIRLNSDFKEFINQGYNIYLEVLDMREIILDNINIKNHDLVNFNLKEFRRLLENYFIIDAKLKNIKVLNK